MWSVPQRRALIALVFIAGAALLAQAILRPVYVGPAQPQQASRAGELADTIDPNTATAAQLATIPDFGQVRAQAVLTYRAQFVKDHPDRPAFSRLEDMRNVKGIGPAMIERLRPFLTFEMPGQ